MNEFITNLQQLVKPKNVITKKDKSEPFRTAYRSGVGEALCVVKPKKLVEFWRVLELCLKFDKIIIIQAANTGLTQGSTPTGPYDRDVVIINTLKMNKIFLLNNRENALCFPGCTLSDLEQKLRPFGRLPHSVLGSSCFGASVVGGVCNNSGGALVHRGPAYTELSLFAKVNDKRELELINNLGIELGSKPLEILEKLDNDFFQYSISNIKAKTPENHNYEKIVRDINAETPARFNANSDFLKDASGCAGKVAVFAVCMDTFPSHKRLKTFYIGTNDTELLQNLRKSILKDFFSLPVIGEYMSQQTVEISQKFGKDLSIVIRFLGPKAVNKLFSIKTKIDKFLSIYFKRANVSDRILQFISDLIPCILPRRIKIFKRKFEHHLILKMENDGIEEARFFLGKFFNKENGDWFECNNQEAKLAEINRFVTAAAIIRKKNILDEKTGPILALDIALKRNEKDWFEILPEAIAKDIYRSFYYGHFFCHVMHHDYILKKRTSPEKVKKKLLKILDDKGAEYPAEHNVGRHYIAKQKLADFYRELDPTNTFNPGIGGLPNGRNYTT